MTFLRTVSRMTRSRSVMSIVLMFSTDKHIVDRTCSISQSERDQIDTAVDLSTGIYMFEYSFFVMRPR